MKGVDLNRPLIVGIDPGITTGVAVLDINGNIIAVYSKREAGRKELLKSISEFGKPIVVASDVNPCPRSVKNFARIFGSRIFYPEESLSVVKKTNLTKKFSENLKNRHEVDSLAAGIRAWKNYRGFFGKIKIELEKNNLSYLFEEIVIEIFNRKSSNISEAIAKSVEKC